MTTYMDVLRAHVVAAEARYLQGGRTLLDDPRAIRDAITEIERLRADNAILAAEVLSLRRLVYGTSKRLPDGTITELPQNQFWRGWYLECEDCRVATDASGALARAGGVE